MTEFKNNIDSPTIPDFSKMDYYARLGVTHSTSEQELKNAFRTLTIQFHPDRHSGDSRMDTAFQYLSEAYTILKDPALRAKYDAKLNYERYAKTADARAAAVHTARPTVYKKETVPFQEVKRNAEIKASISAAVYRDYINTMINNGFPEASELINSENIRAIITKHGLRDAAISPIIYGNYINEWVEAGYDRTLLGNNPKLLEIIKREALVKMEISCNTYRDYTNDWLKAAKINIYGLIKTRDAQKIVKDKLIKAYEIGPAILTVFLRDWVDVGFDKTAFLNDPDFLSVMKTRLARSKFLPLFYEEEKRYLLNLGVALDNF